MRKTVPIVTPQQLGDYVRALRKARGLTQTDVAKMLGVSKMRVATIEKNIGRVSTAGTIELLHLLGASVHLELPSFPDGRGASTGQAHDPQKPVSQRQPSRRGEW